MFNNRLKKESIDKLKNVGNLYEKEFKLLVKNIEKLHEKRLSSLDVLLHVEEFIESLANRPIEYVNIVAEMKLVREDYEDRLNELERKSKSVNNKSGASAAVGAAAGVGVGIFGPAAATSVAMAMGTASTGAAIGSLTGAAATNAALAWLGGGAVAAGGGGIVAGEAVLAMFGPIGWAIGGTAVLGSAIHASKKNKKIAEEAEKSILAINEEIANSKKMNKKVRKITKLTTLLSSEIDSYLEKISQIDKQDYREYTEDEKNMLRVMMNSAEALSKSVGEVIKVD